MEATPSSSGPSAASAALIFPSEQPTREKLTKRPRVPAPADRKFVCNVCDKRFPVKDKLIRHERTHTGEKPFTCQFCGKGFAAKDKLVRHVRIHTGEKPFTCQYCDKAFAVKDKLVRHERIHTTRYIHPDDVTSPFICPDCQKNFTATKVDNPTPTDGSSQVEVNSSVVLQ